MSHVGHRPVSFMGQGQLVPGIFYPSPPPQRKMTPLGAPRGRQYRLLLMYNGEGNVRVIVPEVSRPWHAAAPRRPVIGPPLGSVVRSGPFGFSGRLWCCFYSVGLVRLFVLADRVLADGGVSSWTPPSWFCFGRVVSVADVMEGQACGSEAGEVGAGATCDGSPVRHAIRSVSNAVASKVPELSGSS